MLSPFEPLYSQNSFPVPCDPLHGPYAYKFNTWYCRMSCLIRTMRAIFGSHLLQLTTKGTSSGLVYSSFGLVSSCLALHHAPDVRWLEGWGWGEV